MLTLSVNGLPLDLGADVSISWELRSPVFSALGSRSYPFRLPGTPKNRKILGYRHRVEGSASIYDELPCVIRFNNIDLFWGLMKFKVANLSQYEVIIYEGTGDFAYATQNKLLSDINYGDYSFASAQAGVDYVNHTMYDLLPQYWGYPNFLRAYPMIGNEVYFDPPAVHDELTYYNYRLQSPYYLSLFADYPDPEPNRIIVPMVFFRHVLNTVISSLGYAFTDLVFTAHADFNKLLIYNSLSNNNHCPDFTYSMDKTFLNLHLPRITLKEFLESIEQMFNCRFFISSLDHRVTLRGLDSIVSSSAGSIPWNRGLLSKSIEPDEPVKGFLLEQSLDSSDAHLSEWIARGDQYKSFTRAPVDTVGELPAFPLSIPGDIRYCASTSKFYRFSISKTWVEDPLIRQFQIGRYYYKNFTDSRPIALSSLKPGISYQGSVPMTDCGNALKEYNDIKFRLLFLSSYAISGTSPTRYMPLGTDRTDNYNLWMQGANNMFDKFHKKTCDFKLATEMVRLQRVMNLEELRDFDFTASYLVDSLKYLVRRLQLTLKRDRISPCSIECMRL